jgi:beta-lactamase superfamily II metal-dependent hydrolase
MLGSLALYTALAAETIEVTVIDAGNANCIIAQIPYEGGNVQAVFDAGTELGLSSSDVDKVWARFQEVMGDEEDIELLVVSHVDWDHTSLLPRILDEYEVDLAFYPDRRDALTSNTWKAIHAAIEDKVRIPVPAGTDGSYLGKRFLIGDASFRILTGYNVPPTAYGIAATESKKSEYNNAASIVARLAYWGRSVLFMGDSYGGPDGEATDAPKWGEGDILAKRPSFLIRSDVLVAGHHGANNASFVDFIEKVRPTFVVFSAGQGHNHPYKVTADRFLGEGVALDKIFRTDWNDKKEDEAKEWQHGHTSGTERKVCDDDVLIELERGKPVRVKYVDPTNG